MPILKIGGQELQLGDDFTKLSREKQDQTLNEIAASLNVKPTQPGGPAATEFAKGAVTGIGKGMESFIGAARKITGAPPLDPQTDPLGGSLAAGAQRLQGALPQGQGAAGRFGESAGEMLGNPASYVGPGGMATKAATAVTSGLGAEALGEILQGTRAEPYARIIGAAIGGGLPGKSLAPVKQLPGRERAVARLRQEGVEPTAGDVTGNRMLKISEATLGDTPFAGGKYTEARQKIGEQYTRAALARIGETSDKLTPEVMDRFYARNGRQFDVLAARNAAEFNSPEGGKYIQELHDAVDHYQLLFADPKHQHVVNHVMKNAMGYLVRGKQLDGQTYKAFRSEVERIRRNNAAEPELNQFLGSVRDATDNFMEASIARNNPTDLGAWQETRRQYRNALVLEKASTGAGELAAGGEVTPPKLRQATVSKQGQRNYARGKGDFATLARAGEEVLGRPGSSLTSERAWLHAVPATAGAVGGTLLGGGVEGGLAALAGLGMPAVAGRALMSPAMQWYLKQQLTKNLKGGGKRGAAAEAIEEYGGPQQ